MSRKIKIGIIGLGTMGQGHLKTLLNDVPNSEVAAVCDTDPARFAEAESKGLLNERIRRFDRYPELIEAGGCEAVAVVTPHTSHAEISRHAFARGLHVMCDKPVAIRVSEADAMIRDWKQTAVKFGAMHSMRTTSVNRVIKEWLANGSLGTIQRVDMVCSRWLRTQAYYDAQTWRGTWKGEGAGVLLNQAPHNLDLLYWWFGPATSIGARVTTRHHRMETEDEVEGWIHFAAGGRARFFASTGEASGLDRLEVIGTKGTLTRDGTKLTFREFEQASDVVIGESQCGMPEIPYKDQPVAVPERERGHKMVFRDFFDAILEDRANGSLIAPGDEGIHAVEWANAMLQSSIQKRDVSLPVDRAGYDRLLQDLRDTRISLS
jgi:predicted dehydrogenase